MRRALREATIKYGAPFIIFFWGVLFFGGLTLVLHVSVAVFAYHESLASSLNWGIVAEKVAGGLIFGSVMWFTDGMRSRDANKKDQSNKDDLAR
jgi:hypothetical protein